ncbi:MAG: hypothetical protein HRT47_10145 [Candidatus Caenarcaniphilales bacterium]|nr:hypothetical protein [Candidatus Caenarcaniphilales bacterium]
MKASALPCEASKSAFIDAVSNDTINLVTVDDYDIGESRTINTPVGPGLLQRSGGQVLFTGPGTKTKTVTVTMTTSAFLARDLILQFTVGPMTNGLASCSDRTFLDNVVSNTADNPRVFKAKNLNKNNGNTSYIVPTNTSVNNDSVQSFGVELELKTIPGQVYEATCGAIQEKGAVTESFECNISINQGTSSGEGANDEPVSTEPVEVVEEEVKVQPEVREGNCPLTAIEHLNIAVRTEQAVKARLNGFAEQLEEARLAVSDAGVNPGPAIRRLDILVEFIRDDISEARNAAKGALDFSIRHLECAKEKSESTAADEAIDRAIAHDTEAKTTVMTEDSSLNEESIRLKATLENTVSDIDQGLEDKQDAGTTLDSAYTLPEFNDETVQDVVDSAVGEIESLTEDLKTLLENQFDTIKANNKIAAIDAICEVQVSDCVTQYYEEVVEAYTKAHTKVRQALLDKKKEEESAKRKKAIDRTVKRIDKGYTSVVKSVEKVKKTNNNACPPDSFRFTALARQRRIDKLLKLRTRATLYQDKQWLRIINKALLKEGFSN